MVKNNELKIEKYVNKSNPEDQKEMEGDYDLAWENLINQYGPRIFSQEEYKKIPFDMAGRYLVIKAIACRVCNKIIKTTHVPFNYNGVLEGCLSWGLCEEHDKENS